MKEPDSLSRLLSSWRHEPAARPDFAAEVWTRVEARGQAGPEKAFFRWALPLAAGIAVLAGAGTGLRESRQDHADRMAAAYVRGVDPLQMTGHHHPSP
ncbi:MAG: hypothetical protein JNG83_03075 [Opitutaceae bacterium]|nr:hypothetical protein [Opitutaceae bacterium]